MNANVKTLTFEDVVESALDLVDTTWVIDAKSFNLTQLGWKFKLNNYKTTLGCCRLTCKTIYISECLTRANLQNEEVWLDTIKHEIAHAIDFEIRGITNHDARWKNIARQVGCVPASSQVGEMNFPIGKYTLSCTTCDYKTFKNRISKRKRACHKCCTKYNAGKYSSKYDLILEPTI